MSTARKMYDVLIELLFHERVRKREKTDRDNCVVILYPYWFTRTLNNVTYNLSSKHTLGILAYFPVRVSLISAISKKSIS